MTKNNFWNDAAKYGAIIGAVAIAVDVAGMYTKSMLLTVVSLSIFVTLLYLFTKRRAMLYGNDEEGFSFGRGLKFVVCMMLFAGFLEGAYMSLAANWFFAARYDEMMSQSIAALENTGFYSGEQVEMMIKLTRSPLMLIISSMVGSVIKGAFFGLFVAAMTKREPNIFTNDGNE